MNRQTASEDRGRQITQPALLAIRDVRLTVGKDYREVSAEVDGDRVFFRAPVEHEILCRAEPFLGLALLEAMVRKADIHIEDSVSISEKLHHSLPEIQSVYACWNSDLKPVHVLARTAPCLQRHANVASFYSAGVDSSHTLCRHLDDISQLVMLSVEVAGETPESWRLAVENNLRFARSIGKQLVPIETNAKKWSDKRRIHWAFAQGLVLSSIASLLGAKRLYVAASHTYNQLFPWGSHPLTDPMWTTESTEIIHDGSAFRRGEKMKDLCRHQHLLDNLKVCWHSIHENCGKCSKCIRTMTALYLLGATSRALPVFRYHRGALKTFRSRDESGASFLEDCMILAQETRNAEVFRTLKRYYNWYQIRRVAKMVDRCVLGGMVRNLYRACKELKRSGPKRWRVEMRGLGDWDV